MANDPPPPAVCSVGRAREIITPPVGASLAGYFHDRKGKSVRDDLFARAVVIESGGARVGIVSCDLISVTGEVVDAAREIIQAEAGIAPDHVLVCATHTHTGPEMRADAVVPACEPWAAELPRRIALAVRRAADALTPATLHAGQVNVEGYSFNRLFRMKNGTERFGHGGQPENVVAEAGPIDPQLQTLSAVADDGRLLALLVNFALHPDVIGGGTADFISADWPGEMARNISRIYGDGAEALFLQGTAGDINHVTHSPTLLPRRGPAKAAQLGRALAGAAMVALERAEPMGAVALAAAVETVRIPYYTRDAALRAEVDALRAKPEPTPFERYLVERFDAWGHDGAVADVPVQVMRIGDVGLVALPAEIFVSIGLEIKRFSPTRSTFVVELANARASTYVPTTDQAERGAYGAKPILSRWLCPDAGRRMADTALVLLHKMARHAPT